MKQTDIPSDVQTSVVASVFDNLWKAVQTLDVPEEDKKTFKRILDILMYRQLSCPVSAKKPR